MSEHPPAAAVDNGHDLTWDPPFASAASRWTCSRCGATAIRYSRNEYGAATEVACPSPEAAS